MALVRVRGPLKRLAGDRSEHAIEGGSVGELLAELERSHPAAKGWILDERGVLRRHINVFVNGELVRPGHAGRAATTRSTSCRRSRAVACRPCSRASTAPSGPPRRRGSRSRTRASLRGDGAFEVMRLYGGRPFALDDHLARLARTCAGLRLAVDLDALRAEVDALLEQAGPGRRRCCGSCSPAAAAGSLIIEPLPRARAGRARRDGHATRPTRVLDGLKTLSYAGNMLAGRLARERGYDEALLVTPHGRVLEGPTWSFFWVRDGELLHAAARGPHPRLDHARARDRGVRRAGGAVHARRPARRPRRRSSPRRSARCMPIAAIDDLALPAAPGPGDAATRASARPAIERELASAV